MGLAVLRRRLRARHGRDGLERRGDRLLDGVAVSVDLAMRPDGSHVRRILRNDQNGKRPRLSPDRRWVAFDGAPPGKAPLSDFDIQIVRLDGSGLRTLTRSKHWDLDAQWLPGGKRISFSRMPPHAIWQKAWIWTIGVDGRSLRRITKGQGGRWSPDGRMLVLDAPTEKSDADLFTARADGTHRRRRTATRAPEFAAGWSTDGRTILFTRSPHGNDFEVWTVRADGTHARLLGPGRAAGWSPDGNRILFVDGHQLWVMRPDGSGRRRLSDAIADDPSWR
jgi:Tol biopolymer transport system component